MKNALILLLAFLCGWVACCSSSKHDGAALVGAGVGSQPITPASWTVPNWYIDPANSTGCASNSNSCTSATCGTVGIGPCQTVTEITSHRWGTNSPVLGQTTTLNVLSGETLGQEKIVLKPIVVNQSGFVLQVPQANMATVASFTLGAVTAKNRTTGVLLQAAGFSAAGLAAGQLVINNTHASRAYILSISGSTATLMQPFVPSTVANATTFGYFPAEVDTWASGDSVTVVSPLLLNLNVFDVRGADSNASGTSGGWFWVQGIDVPDTGGTPGSSYWSTQSPDTYGYFVDSKIDPYLLANTVSTGAGIEWIDDYLSAGGVLGDVNFVVGGGTPSTSFGLNADGEFSEFDGDVVLEGTQQSSGIFGNYVVTGWVYVSGPMNLYGHSYVRAEDSLNYPSAALWGPGSLHVNDAAVYEQIGSVTFASHLLVTGGITIGGLTTATSYASAVLTDGRSITAANLDTFGALFDVKTGARICKLN